VNKQKFLYWAPRVLSIGMILFLGLFALDVFTPGQPILYMIGGFLIHLIPNYILAIALFIAWKFELLGGIIFVLLAIIMSLFFRNPLPVNLMLFGPIMLIGILFLVHNYYYRR